MEDMTKYFFKCNCTTKNIHFSTEDMCNVCGYVPDEKFASMDDVKKEIPIGNFFREVLTIHPFTRQLIYIFEGEYTVNGRISNFWRWHIMEIKDGKVSTTGKMGHGYGVYKCIHIPYKSTLFLYVEL